MLTLFNTHQNFYIFFSTNLKNKKQKNIKQLLKKYKKYIEKNKKYILKNIIIYFLYIYKSDGSQDKILYQKELQLKNVQSVETAK